MKLALRNPFTSNNTSAKFIIGDKKLGEKLNVNTRTKNQDSQILPLTNRNQSTALFSLYPQFKNQRSPASLYRANQNYVHKRHVSAQGTMETDKEPPSFMSTISQVRLNQTSQLKIQDEKRK